MIRKTNPRQKRLFDPFQGLSTAADLKILANGWQGLLRYVLLELMPVDQLARHFSAVAGAPTKELHSTAALVLIDMKRGHSTFFLDLPVACERLKVKKKWNDSFPPDWKRSDYLCFRGMPRHMRKPSRESE